VQGVSGDFGNQTPLKTTRYRFKTRISDEVELWGDMVGGHIADKPNGRGMSRRKPEELSAASAGFPFGDFLAILEARIQNVHRTPENTSTPKIVATGTSTTEKLNRSKSVGLWDMIIEPGGVGQGKRP
jgi:hypothetical protein